MASIHRRLQRLFHCLDAKTGKVHWTYDMLRPRGAAAYWQWQGLHHDEDGDVAVFKHSADPRLA